MLRIDCDAHVDETEDTWAFMEESERRFRPVTVDAGGRTWLWPGRTRPRHVRSDSKTGTTEATRTLRDVEARLRHLDELGIDIQVLYSTFFISAPSDRPDVELALCRSYNRWIATATEGSQGRLRWAAVLPLLSMEKALDELRWAKDHGACGVMKRGTEQNRPASDPYFFPLYEEASRLNVPICMHAGSGDPTGVSPVNPRLHAISAFFDLVGAAIPERFPDLRVGWIECGASWIPFMWQDMVARNRAQSWGSNIRGTEGRAGIQLDQDLFRRYRFYVTCETVDDLPYILKFGMEDNLLIGSDYAHSDQSAELRAHEIIERKGSDGEFSMEVARKIVDDNPRRFYAL